MTARRTILPLPLLFLILLLTGCPTSYNDLLTTYNSGFSPVAADGDIMTVEGPGFSEAAMIRHGTYNLRLKGGTLNLNAPADGYNYKWSVWRKGTKLSESNGIHFAIDKSYLQAHRLELGIGYTLKLTVTGRSGKTYTDQAIFIIYEWP